jgi:hypothetical protein
MREKKKRERFSEEQQTERSARGNQTRTCHPLTIMILRAGLGKSSPGRRRIQKMPSTAVAVTAGSRPSSVYWARKSLSPTCSTVGGRVRPAVQDASGTPGSLSALGTRRDRSGDSKRPPGSLGRVAFETNCRSVPVPFALLSKRTARSLVPDPGPSLAGEIRGPSGGRLLNPAAWLQLCQPLLRRVIFVPKNIIVQCIYPDGRAPSTCSAGTVVSTCTLISATHTRSVCVSVGAGVSRLPLDEEGLVKAICDADWKSRAPPGSQKATDYEDDSPSRARARESRTW